MSIDATFSATAGPETLLFTCALSEEPLAAMPSRFSDNELGGQDEHLLRPDARTGARPVAGTRVAAALGTTDRPPSVRVRATTGACFHLHASPLRSASDDHVG